MTLKKEQIIHQIADEVKKYIKQKYDTKTDIDWGLYTGLLGLIIFLYYYAKWTRKKTDIQYANSCLEYYLDNVPLTEIHYSYCSGLSGILVGLDHLNKYHFAEISTSNVLPVLTDYMLQWLKLDIHNHDFMHGTIGLGIMGHFLNCKPIQDALTEELIHQMVIDKEMRWLTFKDFNTNQYIENISLSHGMSSVISYLSMLLTENEFYENEVRLVLRSCINYILSQRYTNYQEIGSFFPYTSLKDYNSKSRLAWCYGDLGVSMALFNAGLSANEKEWKNLAIQILSFSTRRRNTPDNGVVDACFCHGSAGIAQIFNRMYLNTGINQFKVAFEYWVKETINYSKFEDGLAGYKTSFGNLFKNEYSLLEGVAGVGLSLLASINSEQYSSWDSLFLLDLNR